MSREEDQRRPLLQGEPEGSAHPPPPDIQEAKPQHLQTQGSPRGRRNQLQSCSSECISQNF